MNEEILENQKKIVSKYIYAKDNSKPHLMKDIFYKDAILNMKLKTENISFPTESVGLGSITNVLVKEFNITYENVYSFCLLDSLKNDDKNLTCKWLVVMSSKENGTIKIGTGSYQWFFEKDNSYLVRKLIIDIEQMIILEEDSVFKIMNWIKELPYPWCDRKNILQNMPSFKELDSIKNI